MTKISSLPHTPLVFWCKKAKKVFFEKKIKKIKSKESKN